MTMYLVNEMVGKGAKGTIIVYYSTFEVEYGEIKRCPFVKSSVMFDRSQLAAYEIKEIEIPKENLTTEIEKCDHFVCNTQAIIEHHVGGAYYTPAKDKIIMPFREFFLDTDACTATQGYYSVLLHALSQWTGDKPPRDTISYKTFGDEKYAVEEVADLWNAFLREEI